jgi:hypothetical protein
MRPLSCCWEASKALLLQRFLSASTLANGPLTKETWLRESACLTATCLEFIFEPNEITDLAAYFVTIRNHKRSERCQPSRNDLNYG